MERRRILWSTEWTRKLRENQFQVAERGGHMLKIEHYGEIHFDIDEARAMAEAILRWCDEREGK